MSELSPRARELMKKAAPGGGPSEQRRRALKRAVMGAALAPALAAAASTKLLLVGLAVGTLAVGGIAVTRMRQAPARAPALTQPLEVAPKAPAVQAPSAEPEEVALPEVTPQASPRRSPPEPAPAPAPATPPAPRTEFALELQTLDRAVEAVDAARYEEALVAARALLSDSPKSELATEARVVEVLALCGLSRVGEAQEAAGRLPVEASRNPAVRRLDASCVELIGP